MALSHLQTFSAALIASMFLASCSGVADRRTEAVFDEIAPEEVVTVSGTEPFWGATIERGQLVWTTPDNPDGTAVEVRRFAGNGGVAWSGELDGEKLDIAVGPGPCSDGMSDRTYPFSAAVSLGERTLTGCAYTDQTGFQGAANP